MKVPGRRIGRRVHMYDAYEYLLDNYSKDMAKKFLERMKHKHPRIYKNEVEPYLRR